MVQLHFPDAHTERKALGFLAGRFSFRSFNDGTTLVPEAALRYLAAEGIGFTVEGTACYQQIVPAPADSARPDVQ